MSSRVFCAKKLRDAQARSSGQRRAPRSSSNSLTACTHGWLSERCYYGVDQSTRNVGSLPALITLHDDTGIAHFHGVNGVSVSMALEAESVVRSDEVFRAVVFRAVVFCFEFLQLDTLPMETIKPRHQRRGAQRSPERRVLP